jgi:hypothetical protein
MVYATIHISARLEKNIRLESSTSLRFTRNLFSKRSWHNNAQISNLKIKSCKSIFLIYQHYKINNSVNNGAFFTIPM